MQNEINKVALAYILDLRGDLFIAKRGQSKHTVGFWEFPGGELKGGGSRVQAIQREFLEELAIEVAATTLLVSFILPKDSDLEFFPAICQRLSGDTVLFGYDEYSFVTLEIFDPLSLAPANVTAAQMSVNYSRTNPEN